MTEKITKTVFKAMVWAMVIAFIAMVGIFYFNFSNFVSFDNGNVFISEAVVEMDNLQNSALIGLVCSLLIGGALAYYLADKTGRNLGQYLKNVDLDNPMAHISCQELAPLLIQIEKKNSRTKLQIADLKQKNQEIAYVIENVSDGILVLNELGMILTANKMAKQLLGCKEDSFYLDSFRDINYRDVVQSALSGTNLAKSVTIGEKVYRFSASTTDSDMNKFAVFLFISDITDEEKSLEMRRQFTANVSHELKTPLSSIMGSAEIMANGIARAEDCPHFAKNIFDEANRLLKLIQDILKISTMDEEQIAYDFEEVDIAKICRGVQSVLMSKAKKVDVEILVDLPDENITVCGYQQIICDLAYNLCDNAITYNKKGGTVSLKVFKCEKSVILQVVDTGIGIGKDDINHIFERFYRVDKSHSKDSGGTGLGLSIVKHAAAIHKAEIAIESELNQGTTITVKFPKCENCNL